ncbi:amidase [Bacteroidota bacterium]
MFTSESYLSKIAAGLRNNSIDANQYIEEICDSINKYDDKIKSLLPEYKRLERLKNEISILKKRFPNLDKRPLLFGVPIGIKDIISVNGFETRAGSKLPPELFKGNEASVVTKLKNAGAIILGKTESTEFAYFEPGPTRNPHNLEHTPGGSSSGSAAAVACGFTPLALGTQTIGSISRPAAYCGIVGFKPSFNRIASDGVIPFSTSADHVGFFTQDLEGVNLTASILCDNWKITTNEQNKKPVIGVVEGNYLNQASDEILNHYEKKINELQKAGFTVKRLDLFGNIDEINTKHKKMTAAEFSEVHNQWFQQYEDLYRKGTKDLILEGKKITNAELTESIKGREEFQNKIEKTKSDNKIDIWLSPSTTTTAPKGTNTGSPLMNLPWTYSGLPTITIPAGKSEKNLPIGLQLAGSFYKDEELLEYTKMINENLNN